MEERKVVQIFKTGQVLKKEHKDKLREEINEGIESGILILSPGEDYCGCLEYPRRDVINFAEIGETLAQGMTEGVAVEQEVTIETE